MAKKVGRKYRVVEAKTGKVAKNRAGTATDGGGHASKRAAVSQVNAINLSERRRAGKSAPVRPRRRQ